MLEDLKDERQELRKQKRTGKWEDLRAENKGPDDPTNSFRHAGSNKQTNDGVRIYLGGPDWEGDMVLTYKLNPSPLSAHSAGGAAVWREG